MRKQKGQELDEGEPPSFVLQVVLVVVVAVVVVVVVAVVFVVGGSKQCPVWALCGVRT